MTTLDDAIAWAQGRLPASVIEILVAGPQAIYSPTDGTYVDTNSLVAGDISAGSWFHQQNNLWQCFGQNSDGFYDAHQLNRFVGTGRSFHWFVLPVGATGVTFRLTGYEPSAKAVRLALINTSIVEISGANIALTATSATYTFSATALTPGTTYGLSIETSNAGQLANPVISLLTAVTIGNPQGVFNGDYIRLGVEPSWFGGTSYSSSWGAGLGGEFIKHTTFADATLWTDAPQMAIESWGNTGGSTTSNIGVLVDGNGFAVGAFVPGPGAAIDNFALPYRSTGRIITIRGGVWQAATPTSNFLRAVYLPRGYKYELQQTTANQRIIVIGDSIGLGGTTTSPHFQCWTMHLRRRYPGDCLIDCYNGRQAFTDMNTAALRAVFSAKLAVNQPTDIWIALGVNDYINASWTAANFGIGYAAMLDSLHAVIPGARIWSQSPILKTTEVANGLGDTLGAFRTQISTAASNASRVPWSTFVDGTTSRFPLVADLSDGIHPNTLGHLKYGDAVINTLQTGNVL